MQINGNAVSFKQYYEDLAGKKSKTSPASFGSTLALAGEGGGEGAKFSELLAQAASRLTTTTSPTSSTSDNTSSGKELLSQLERSSRVSGAFGTEEDRERAKDMLAGLAIKLLRAESRGFTGEIGSGAAHLMTGMIKGAYGA